jgi:hypothetical protein
MKGAFVLVFAVLAMPAQKAFSDEMRIGSFPNAMVGTWAETAEMCKAKAESNVVIGPGKYGDAMANCEVRAISITPGRGGVANYAVRSVCTNAKDATKIETENMIVRVEGADRAVMGSSFDDLKVYQRCSVE